MSKLNFLIPLFFLLLANTAFAQREDVGNYEYDREYLLGINKNTNGGLIGGVALKVGSRIDDSQFAYFGLELANVKHPKEVRYTTVTGNNYISANQITSMPYALTMEGSSFYSRKLQIREFRFLH